MRYVENNVLEVFSETLILKVGTSSISFYGWYAAAPWMTQKVSNLQIVIEGTSARYSQGCIARGAT